MPGVTGKRVGFIATLYKSPLIASKTLTLVEAALVTANSVADVYDMGTLTKERDIVDLKLYGQDISSKITGQADPGTFDFTVAMNLGDTQHKAIRDDTGLTQFTFIVEYTVGTNKTYAAFDGFIATSDVEQAVDDVIKMNVSIARDGGITWLDKA